MPVQFKSLLSSQVVNETFVDATIPSDKKDRLGLYKTDLSDADAIDDVQDYINLQADVNGIAGEDDTTAKDYASTEVISNGQNRKEAIEALDAQVGANTDALDNLDVDAKKFVEFVDDVAYEAEYGTPTGGEVYYNTATGLVRYYDAVTGEWTDVGSGSGGISSSSVEFKLTTDISPYEFTDTNGLSLLAFDGESNQSVRAVITIPSGYEGGIQIKLKNLLGYSSGSADNVLINATTTLVKIGDISDSLTNTYDSTNTELTLSTSNEILTIGDVDLTDSSGEINSVAVTANDLLLVELRRDNDAETSSSLEDFNIIRNSVQVSFEE